MNHQLCLVLFWRHHPNEVIYDICHDSGWSAGDRRYNSHGYVECAIACPMTPEDSHYPLEFIPPVAS